MRNEARESRFPRTSHAVLRSFNFILKILGSHLRFFVEESDMVRSVFQ